MYTKVFGIMRFRTLPTH